MPLNFTIRLFSKLMQRVREYRSFQSQGLKSFTTVANVMSEPIVSVSQGRLKGAVKDLLDGTKYYSFKGIPYAQPPVGSLRFQAPRPPLPWQGIHEAIDHGPVCPQFDLFLNQYIDGSEDCLFLNVYTKTLNTNSKTPVMVFIHGGGYMCGSGNTDSGYGPEFLLQHNVILVTLNYRLEVLGFLCLDTPEVPGNAGMKDQVFALRWVKQNIANFGGDPDNVTIFGESAGSSSVVFHMLSPMSQGLFNKAIAQSGVALCDWANGFNSKDRAFRVGKVLGYETNDIEKLLEFLRNVPAIDLAHLTFKTMTAEEKPRGLPISFAPVVEKKFDNVDAFLTEEPLDIIVSNKINDIPLMLGYTSTEAISLVEHRMKKLKFTNENLQYLVPREITLKVTKAKLDHFGELIRRFYVGNKEFGKEDAQDIADLLTDINFSYNIHRFAYLYSAKSNSPTFMYKFNLDTDLNIVKKFSAFSHLKGAKHADDLFYLFCTEATKDVYDEQEKLKDIVFKVTKLWTDFAKTGNPTPDNVEVKWTPYTPSKKEFFNIEQKYSMGRYADQQRVEFWNKLYREAGLPCIDNIKSSL